MAARRYRGAARKLLTLSPGDWRDLLSAQVALLWAQVLVWTRPEGELVARSTPKPAHDDARSQPPDGEQRDAEEPDAAHLHDARRLALATRRAAAFGVFRPACLVRSIALCRLMEARGLHGGRVEVGVALTKGKFVAHAWVRWGSAILGDDDATVAVYRPLTDVGVRYRE